MSQEDTEEPENADSYATILKVLTQLDGYCLDNSEERKTVARAVASMLDLGKEPEDFEPKSRAIREDQKLVTVMTPVQFVMPKTWHAIVRISTGEIVAKFASSDMCSDVLWGENSDRPSYFDYPKRFKQLVIKE